MVNNEDQRTRPTEIYIRSEIKYLGLNPELYAANPNLYKQGESPDDRLDKLMSDPKSYESRRIMFSCIVKLKKALLEFDKSGDHNLNYDEFLKNTIHKIAIDATEQIINKVERENTKRFLEEKLNGEGMLFKHLEETGLTVEKFNKYIPNELLGDRNKKLLVFAARTHDIGKLLGGLNAQIDPDHEILYKEIIGQHLVGKKFTYQGETVIFTQEDIDFITSVVGFHEDIYREEYFASQAESLKKDTVLKDPEKTVQRARTIFHCIDIYGKAVSFQDGALKITDQEAFRTRFIDLFQRHIKLPLDYSNSGGIDWTIGKVFRPQWGEHGVAGLTETFSLLEEWSVKVDPELVRAVEDGILEVLVKAEDSIIIAKIENFKPEPITDTDYQTLEKEIEKSLEKITEVRERMEKEIISRRQQKQ